MLKMGNKYLWCGYFLVFYLAIIFAALLGFVPINDSGKEISFTYDKKQYVVKK
jgi:hypothetical protein